MLAPHAAQDYPEVSGRRLQGGGQCIVGQRNRLVARQHHLYAVHVHRIADPEHRHAPHPAPVHVHAARAFGDRKPHPAPVQAEAHDRIGVVRRGMQSCRITRDRLHALVQRQLRAVFGDS